LLEAPGADIFSSPDMPFSDDPAALDLSVGAANAAFDNTQPTLDD